MVRVMYGGDGEGGVGGDGQGENDSGKTENKCDFHFKKVIYLKYDHAIERVLSLTMMHI